MDQKKPFVSTPHGRAFIQVFQVLVQDLVYFGRHNDAWLSTLALFGQVKADWINGQADRSTYFRTRPEEYWSKMGSQLGLGSAYFSVPASAASHEQALVKVSELIPTWNPAEWEFFDTPWYVAGKGFYDFPFGVSPEVADLIADSFGDVSGKYAWCLFSGSCQVAYRLAKKGANVVLTGDTPFMDGVLRIMNRLHKEMLHEEVKPWNPLLSHPDENTAPYDIGVAFPPFAVRELPHTLAFLSVFDNDDAWPIQQNRPDMLAVRAMWEKVRGKATIFAPPSLLFSTGQERQAREHLVLDLNAVDTVVHLPARQLAGAGVGSALLMLSHGRIADQPIRLIDASIVTEKEGRTGIKMQAIEKIASLVRREGDDPILVRDVAIRELHGSDISLYPPRYFSSVLLSGDSVTLSNLIESVIRPPAKPAGRDEGQAEEINISDLNEWGCVGENTKTKTITVRQTKLQASRLRNDDILFSTKGSLGKVGIFHAADVGDAAGKTYVVSQSCIALRLSAEGKKRIRPIALYMYLRSAIGRAAIDALNVGSAMPHIQPGALIEHLKIPVLPLTEQDKLEKTFHAMVALQREVRETQDKLDTLSKSYWPAQDGEVSNRAA